MKATFLIPKDRKESIEKLKNEINKSILNHRKKIKIPSDRWCIRDGDSEQFAEYDGYANHWALKASNNNKPKLLSRTLNEVTEEDNLIYGGCYVNAIINFWIQDNQFGKRVNANLLGVQFFKHGEAFVANNVDVTNEFDTYEEEETEQTEKHEIDDVPF